MIDKIDLDILKQLPSASDLESPYDDKDIKLGQAGLTKKRTVDKPSKVDWSVQLPGDQQSVEHSPYKFLEEEGK